MFLFRHRAGMLLLILNLHSSCPRSHCSCYRSWNCFCSDHGLHWLHWLNCRHRFRWCYCSRKSHRSCDNKITRNCYWYWCCFLFRYRSLITDYTDYTDYTAVTDSADVSVPAQGRDAVSVAEAAPITDYTDDTDSADVSVQVKVITDYTDYTDSADVSVQVKVVDPEPAQPLSPQTPLLLLILKLFLFRYRSLITDYTDYTDYTPVTDSADVSLLE